MDDFFRAMAKIDALKEMPDDWPNTGKEGKPMAKGFKDAAAAAQPVYSTIIGSAQQKQEPQDAPETQDTQAVQEAQATQGRKGMKMQRINMAFTPTNIDYIRVMAAIRGQTMTQFVNAIIAQDREQNGDAYEAAKELTKGKSL